MSLKKHKLFFICLLLIIGGGAFLRFSYNSRIYTECDDIEVVGLYKKNQPIPSVKVRALVKKILEVSRINADQAKSHLLDSWLFPAYMGYQWTYPPGQYIIYPLVIRESDSFNAKLIKGRSVSGLINLASLPLFAYLLFLLNGKKWDERFLLPVIMLGLSFNAVLYSNHMSPYAASVTTMVMALIFLEKAMKRRISLVKLFALLAILTYFNYLIIFLLPPLAIILTIYFKFPGLKEMAKKLFWPFLMYGAFFAPALIFFFKRKGGVRGELPPPFDFSGALGWVFFIGRQFFKALSSAVAFFSTSEAVNLLLTIAVVGAGLYFLFRDFRKKGDLPVAWLFVLLSYIFWIEWIALYLMGKIVMDRTRHMLVWLPLFAIIIFYLFSRVKINRYVFLPAMVVLSAAGFIGNYNIIHTKFSNFDYGSINSRQGITTILSYNPTGDSDLYLYYQNKNIYNLNDRFFRYDEHILPKEVLLFSKDIKLEEFLKNSLITEPARDNMKMLIRDYDYDIINEVDSRTYFPYDNYPVSSNPNNFFLYKLTRKEI